ncbi:S8 family serine peptidase [Fodinicola feengrottensis]|uniref:S8 family serine peptidase n=1 Tax=Fodinicola feengrottensis TaxID=435914 RepID=UPI00244210C9|nr:S8 family serine peptidase [Fodinicola feengrottensis]
MPTAPPPKPVNLGGHCAAAASSTSPSNWAALRLAPNQAWSRTRGKGQLVAIVDSGADGSLPQLAGHIAIGADVVSGSGRGNTDCLGSGTGMAGIVVAQAAGGSTMSGVAPDATVLPVRVVTTTPTATPANEAAAIQVAVSAGAGVIALGSYVNVNDPAVAKAIAAAVGRDIVVVLAAGTSGSTNPALAGAKAATLRVGGVGVDGSLAAAYQVGTVNVVAPGMNVSTLGITGTGTVPANGTQFSVAFVAAEVALVRAALPGLSAVQVVHRVEVTADRMSSGAVPDSHYGFGMINPAESVTRALPEERQSISPPTERFGTSVVAAGATGSPR